MGEFLDFIKNKKNLLSLLLLGIVVLAIPLGIKLIREQQIIKSRATSDPIVFTGPNVNKKSDGSWVALKPQISLEITSPLGLPIPPVSSPSATPTATPVPSPTVAPLPIAGEVSFVLDPMQASKIMGEEFNVVLDLNAESFNISAVDVTVNFDKDKLELTDFVPDLGSDIEKIIYDKNPLSGYFRYAGARKADIGRVTGTIRLGAVQFKAKDIEGIAQITFGNTQVTSSDRSDPLTVGSNPGSYTINPAPSAVTTVSFRIAENLSDLDAEAVKTPWQAYTAQPMLVDYGFKDKTAGVKTVFVQFKDSSGKTGGCGDGSQPCQAQIKLLGPDPAISGCSLSFEASNTTLNLTGQNFGLSKGTVTSGDTNLSVSSWADSSIKAVWPDAPIGQTLAVVITNPDGQSAEGNCSAIAQLSVGARVFCSQPFAHQAANVNLSLVGAFDGGTKIKQNVSIDSSGVIQNLSAKLETGKNYVLSLKAPKSLRTNVCFTAQDGTTNISSFVLPVGDVFPVEGGDGQINSLDKAELNRQWNISDDTTGRSTDFNGDSRVNTIDWACMRNSWNGADMSEPVPGLRQSVSCPAASLSSDVSPSSGPSSPSPSPSSSPSLSPSLSPSSSPSPASSPSPSPSVSPSPSPSPSASLPAV